ncbi:hypothetical protein ACWD25_28445 [Streptomyces sp. NPDC002920]
MSNYPEIARHFENDFAEATLTVQREDGLYRHVEFSAPKTMNRLLLVTWPYNLVVAGSHGSFHFERYGADTEDMCDWLRGTRVNPSSWTSKLVNGADSVREYDRDRLERQVKERVEEAARDGWAPDGLQAAVREEILDNHLLDTKDTAFQLISEFQHGMTYRSECSCGLSEDFKGHDSYSSAATWEFYKHKADGKKHKVKVRQTGGFDFDDFTEWNVDKLNYHFVYQCHAAVWAIAQYDAARKVVAANA